MSVQNGERLATKQDLADMYSGILPYLGGMPEVLANKFSKGDLYDTSEKMIGKWYNNKPLYQKVIIFPQAVTLTGNSWGNTGVSISNTLHQESLLFVSVFNANNSYPAIGGTSGGVLEVMHFRTSTTFDATGAVICYTKTTDSANSFNIGEATDYSTDEKIIGTWLNGEPLYQKTISCGALPNKTLKNVAHGISNLNKVVNLYGMAYNNSYWSSLPKVHDKDINIQCAIYVDSTNIMIEGRETDFSGFTESYITLQYTKSNS